MARYVKSVGFHNRAALVGFDSAGDDARLNAVLDELRGAGAEIIDIKPTAGGWFFKYVLTYVVIYEAPAPIG